MKPLLLIFLCALCGYSQTPSPTPLPYSETPDEIVKPTRPNEKPRTLDELKALAKKTKLNDDLIFGWDKFKDESIIAAKYENIVGSWEGAFAIVGSSRGYDSGTPRILVVGIEWRFAGQTLRETPDQFALVFQGMSPDWQFFKTGSTLYVLFDGDRLMQLEAVARDHDIVKYNRVDESVAYLITREQIAALVNAKKVEIRIGDAKPREIKPKLLKHWKAILDITQLEPEK